MADHGELVKRLAAYSRGRDERDVTWDQLKPVANWTRGVADNCTADNRSSTLYPTTVPVAIQYLVVPFSIRLTGGGE